MDTLEASKISIEVYEIRITSGRQNGLYPLCECHFSVHLFSERMSAIEIDIRAHCQSTYFINLLPVLSSNLLKVGQDD